MHRGETGLNEVENITTWLAKKIVIGYGHIKVWTPGGTGIKLYRVLATMN